MPGYRHAFQEYSAQPQYRYISNLHHRQETRTAKSNCLICKTKHHDNLVGIRIGMSAWTCSHTPVYDVRQLQTEFQCPLSSSFLRVCISTKEKVCKVTRDIWVFPAATGGSSGTHVESQVAARHTAVAQEYVHVLVRANHYEKAVNKVPSKLPSKSADCHLLCLIIDFMWLYYNCSFYHLYWNVFRYFDCNFYSIVF